MTELEMRDAIVRANRAMQIIEDPMIQEAFDLMRQDAYAKIEATKPGQAQEREYLYLYLKAITNFEQQFAFTIDEGRVAKSKWDEFVLAQRAKKSRRKA